MKDAAKEMWKFGSQFLAELRQLNRLPRLA